MDLNLAAILCLEIRDLLGNVALEQLARPTAHSGEETGAELFQISLEAPLAAALRLPHLQIIAATEHVTTSGRWVRPYL